MKQDSFSVNLRIALVLKKNKQTQTWTEQNKQNNWSEIEEPKRKSSRVLLLLPWNDTPSPRDNDGRSGKFGASEKKKQKKNCSTKIH